MQKRKDIPMRIKKLLWQEAQNKCALCQNDDIDVLENHHIEDWSKTQDDSLENLILVCSNCHSKITNGSISQAEVFKAKIRLPKINTESKVRSNVLKFPNPQNIINLKRIKNSGVIANNVKITTTTKLIKLEPPNGTIGSDGDKRSYVKRLIDRYNEFKKAEYGLIDFDYRAIYGAINKEFKCKWDFIRSENFLALVLFLQKRIDNTRLGRNRKSKKQKNYSSFQEFLNHSDSFQNVK